MKKEEEANVVQLKIYLEPRLHLVFKILCAHEKRRMTGVASELIESWVEEKAKRVDLNKLLREF